MLMPFLNQMDLRYFYVEKFIKYDNTDFRVDVVDGEFVACYGRKANGTDWRTNITAGGSVFMREANDDIINTAINACKATGVDIGGVDIIYDLEKEEYIVLEVNGIPAFATPEQEKMGLDFNNKKIDLIVDLIDRKIAK
jgi:ribosomal protein S6--L-glutamate ligase